MKKISKNDVQVLLKSLNDETKVYFGCDSIRFKVKGKWHAEYTTVLVVHKNGRHGCKIFTTLQSNDERSYASGCTIPRV